MKFNKQVIAQMPLAYAIGLVKVDDSQEASILVGCEKHGPINRFDLEGNFVEEVVPGPGGVMTISGLPNTTNQFLATAEFFSPNFGADTAKILCYTKRENGWDTNVVCELPYVHRFGILSGTDGTPWLLACTIKGACRQGVKEDWQTPGASYACPLTKPLDSYSLENQLPLTSIANNQVQNHGFWIAPDLSYALVTTSSGVFRYVPPQTVDGTWSIECLIVDPTSDVCAVDLDGDGALELVTFSRFHGDTLKVWHQTEVQDQYECVYEHESKLPFLHAIYSGTILGVPAAVVGHRKGDQALYVITYGEEGYELKSADQGFGPANACILPGTTDAVKVVATNRETNEVGLYIISNE